RPRGRASVDAWLTRSARGILARVFSVDAVRKAPIDRQVAPSDHGAGGTEALDQIGAGDENLRRFSLCSKSDKNSANTASSGGLQMDRWRPSMPPSTRSTALRSRSRFRTRAR